MPPPLCIIDLETTGLSPLTHAPIAVAALVLGGDYDNHVFRGQFRPADGLQIDARALAVNGYTYDTIMQWRPSVEVFEDFVQWLKLTHPSPLQVLPVGHNYKFDESFLRAWFVRHASQELYGNMFGPAIDTIECIKTVWPDRHGGRWPSKGGHSLSFQHQYHFGSVHKEAHTELADCYATRSLFLHCDRTSGKNEWVEFHHHIPELPANTLS